jgi:hypothetical protein
MIHFAKSRANVGSVSNIIVVEQARELDVSRERRAVRGCGNSFLHSYGMYPCDSPFTFR